MNAIDARNVHKTYGEGATAYQALRGVDFAVARGELVTLVGPSGSGKTTLLSILGCVLTPSVGRVELFGLPVTGREDNLPLLRRALIGFVFQGHNLTSSLTALENVRLVLSLRGVSHRESRREAVAILERVGLGDRLDWLPAELSGGQRQRVALARALAGAPPLLLADEPTASLDAETGRQVMALLVELCRERDVTVVIVTHDERILPLADRVVRIEDGRIGT